MAAVAAHESPERDAKRVIRRTESRHDAEEEEQEAEAAAVVVELSCAVTNDTCYWNTGAALSAAAAQVACTIA